MLFDLRAFFELLNTSTVSQNLMIAHKPPIRAGYSTALLRAYLSGFTSPVFSIFLLKEHSSGLNFLKRIGDMSGSPSLRWVGVFGQLEYVIPCDLGIIAIFWLGFGFALLSIWLDMKVIQSFLTTNRPVLSMPRSRLNCRWLHRRSGFDQTAQEVDLANRRRIGDSIKFIEFLPIDSLQKVKMTIVCWF